MLCLVLLHEIEKKRLKTESEILTLGINFFGCFLVWVFFWPHAQHMVVPGPGIEPVPQQ